MGISHKSVTYKPVLGDFTLLNSTGIFVKLIQEYRGGA